MNNKNKNYQKKKKSQNKNVKTTKKKQICLKTNQKFITLSIKTASENYLNLKHK